MATKEMTLLGMDVRDGAYEPTGQPAAYFYRDPLTDSAFVIIEDNAREIACELFVDRGSQTQPFFADAAREVFANLMIYLVRRSQENPEAFKDQLNNAELKRMAIKIDARSLTKLFSVYDDMSGLVSLFGDGTTAQGLGVLGEMKSMVYDCFQGAFAQRAAPGTSGFGIREFVRNKGGKAVFIEYDLTRGLVLQPVYRMLVDLAIKESRSDSPCLLKTCLREEPWHTASERSCFCSSLLSARCG